MARSLQMFGMTNGTSCGDGYEGLWAYLIPDL